MNRSRPFLELPATVVFAGFDLEKQRWNTPAFSDAFLDHAHPAKADEYADRELLLRHCRALLSAAVSNPSAAAQHFSIHIARVCNNSYRAGRADGVRQSAIIQARKAQAAKKQKADARGNIIRQAIVAVCKRQKLAPIASEKFAASIRSDVIEAARQFGLTDVKAGTSTRTIRRHIAALLE
jgi:hypothetical protein